MSKRPDESQTEFTMRMVRNEIIDECAKVAEAEIDPDWPNDDQSNQARRIADAIRQMKAS